MWMLQLLWLQNEKVNENYQNNTKDFFPNDRNSNLEITHLGTEPLNQDSDQQIE